MIVGVVMLTCASILIKMAAEVMATSTYSTSTHPVSVIVCLAHLLSIATETASGSCHVISYSSHYLRGVLLVT